MPDLPRLAHWLRMWADRIDDNGAIKRANVSFTFETGKGQVLREDGKGCPLYFVQSDYERAHNEADSNQPDPLKEDVMRFLDALDREGKLPPGWSVGGVAGREDDSRG